MALSSAQTSSDPAACIQTNAMHLKQTPTYCETRLPLDAIYFAVPPYVFRHWNVHAPMPLPAPPSEAYNMYNAASWPHRQYT